MTDAAVTDSHEHQPNVTTSPEAERRSFLSKIAMFIGLAGGYGTFAAMAGRYLFPANGAKKSWLFVTDLASFSQGSSMLFRAPDSRTITITRLKNEGQSSDFIALSSVCPHLGCQVHWESQNNRFFCPCHNGVFDAEGKGIGGPPGEAGQNLSHFKLNVENDLLFIELENTILS